MVTGWVTDPRRQVQSKVAGWVRVLSRGGNGGNGLIRGGHLHMREQQVVLESIRQQYFFDWWAFFLFVGCSGSWLGQDSVRMIIVRQ